MNTAKIFQNGGSQAVRLPKEFAFQGAEVFVRRVGRAVVLLPKDDPWAVMEQGIDQFTPDFLAEREQPGHQEREAL
jgi:antitoxin VapB